MDYSPYGFFGTNDPSKILEEIKKNLNEEQEKSKEPNVTLRIERCREENWKTIKCEEIEKVINEHLGNVWENYPELENKWKKDTKEEKIEVPKTITLCVEVYKKSEFSEAQEEKPPACYSGDWWKVIYYPNPNDPENSKEEYWWNYSASGTDHNKISEIFENHAIENEEVKRYFGSRVLTHEEMKNALIEIFKRNDVVAVVLTVVKTNEYGNLLIKESPYKNIALVKKENNEVSYVEWESDEKVIYPSDLIYALNGPDVFVEAKLNK